MENDIDFQKWATPKDVARTLKVDTGTVRRWAKEGRLEYITTPGGHHRYNADSLKPAGTYKTKPEKKIPLQSNGEPRFGAIYCRVSSHKQKDDLERQIQACQEKYPEHKVYQDICSGLKYERQGLPRLLEHVSRGMVKEIVVAHKDRLARFGTELIQWILNRHQTRLVTLHQDHYSSQEELTQDLMAIVHVFSGRFNGKRRYRQIDATREGEEGTSVPRKKPRRENHSQGTIRSGVESQASQVKENSITETGSESASALYNV